MYDNFLALDVNTERLQLECLHYVFKRPRIMNKTQRVNFIEPDSDEEIYREIPSLKTTFAPLGLTVNCIRFFVMRNQSECAIHTDMWPNKARINVPLLNCADTRLEYYSGVEMQTVVNANGKEVQLIRSGTPILDNFVEIKTATCIMVNRPHKVIMGKSPRITATVDFKEDVSEFLRMRQLAVLSLPLDGINTTRVGNYNYDGVLTKQKDWLNIQEIFSHKGLEVENVLSFEFKPNEIQSLHVDGSLGFVRNSGFNIRVSGNATVEWYPKDLPTRSGIYNGNPFIAIDRGDVLPFRKEELMDCAVFDSSAPHRLINGPEATRIISVRFKGNPTYEKLHELITLLPKP